MPFKTVHPGQPHDIEGNLLVRGEGCADILVKNPDGDMTGNPLLKTADAGPQAAQRHARVLSFEALPTRTMKTGLLHRFRPADLSSAHDTGDNS
jgi:hypothetical protein